MSQTQTKLHSVERKRKILVADDEFVNREILRNILQDEYEVLTSVDGPDTLEKIRECRGTLSLVLLDILMPGMTGMEVLKTVKADDGLSRVPIIVITSEQSAEVESLKLGAADFIPKPYPDVEVVKARVQKTIELSEDRQIIQRTERDTLTGLYNREFFYRYAEQYDQFHQEDRMDAILIDVNHFHTLNERYGKAFGDEVLRRISASLLSAAGEREMIIGRREADTFMVYCPHTEEHSEFLDSLQEIASKIDDVAGRVRLRMGVYPDAEKSIDMESRFDRAKMASDTVRGSVTNTVGYYDAALHKKELYAEQLIEGFSAAIQEEQFEIYYQPKFDIRPETPILTGAEALVRWQHPELGMISPGVFIPLFEENGLILQLDAYVWKKAAEQIRQWNEEFGYIVPVSVNVSRVDLFDPTLKDTLVDIVRSCGLNNTDLHLEVTESAYTQNSEQIISVVEELRILGFKIEMDDFGTGYSSLNMISDLPIDVLKLDMQFIRNAFKTGGKTYMIEIIVSIADYLGVPVIAEGVETEQQLDTLRNLGCDIVQGYFFSKPVPAKEFDAFILQRKESDKARVESNWAKSARYNRKENIKTGITGAEESSARTEQSSAPEGGSPAAGKGLGGLGIADMASPGTGLLPNSGIHLRTANIFFTVLAAIVAVALFVADLAVTRGYQRMERASDRYIAAQLAASDMESASDYLTDRVRCFVVTGDIQYLSDFFEEVNITRRRDKAVENLSELLGGDSGSALNSLNAALELSNELVKTEHLAMRLALDAGNYRQGEIPDELSAITLSAEDRALSAVEKQKKAETLVFDNSYMHYKDRIRENVSLCTQALIRSSSQELDKASTRMSVLVTIQTALTILFLLIVVGMVVMIWLTIRRPLSRMVELMLKQEIIPPTGAEELRFVTRTYNAILQENIESRERLSHAASHDALTGLFNRGAYDMLMESVDREHMALIMLDIDYFKEINDTYGHAVGDRVLQRVAEILQKSFRSVDIICRIGGDEFVVVMTRSNSSMKQLVENKINRANDLLQHPKDGLPPVSLSVGVAFADRDHPKGDIFADADEALYRVKQAGRNGVAFYG